MLLGLHTEQQAYWLWPEQLLLQHLQMMLVLVDTWGLLLGTIPADVGPQHCWVSLVGQQQQVWQQLLEQLLWHLLVKAGSNLADQAIHYWEQLQGQLLSLLLELTGVLQ